MVRVAAFSSESMFVPNIHWYPIALQEVAVTVNVAVVPTRLVVLCGCAVISGTLPSTTVIVAWHVA